MKMAYDPFYSRRSSIPAGRGASVASTNVVVWASVNFRLQPKNDDGGIIWLRQNSATPSPLLCCRRMI